MKNTLGYLLTFAVTAVLSVTLTLSSLRTAWTGYTFDVLAWWSIVSAILNVVLAGFSLWQFLEAEGQKKRGKSQVKIWMQDANGIVNALRSIRSATHTKISDALNSVSIVETSASAMYQSLYEERVVKEEKYQESEERKAEILNQREVDLLKAQASSASTNSISQSSRQRKFTLS